ncbi:hypothetical protein NSP70_24830, partial [Salmonella enterica]|nr:hypothetical protein [Salmonella enterica]
RNPKAAAAGGNEDEEGEVRSERSGPQSWAPAIGSARPRGDLRRLNNAKKKRPEPDVQARSSNDHHLDRKKNPSLRQRILKLRTLHLHQLPILQPQ